jgi:hypothetical protein
MEGRLPSGAGGLELVDHFVAEAARIDEAGDRGRNDVLASAMISSRSVVAVTPIGPMPLISPMSRPALVPL